MDIFELINLLGGKSNIFSVLNIILRIKVIINDKLIV